MAAKEVTLANLGGGELMALASRELHKIGDNIADPNIRTDAVRKMQINISVKPDKKGQTAEITYSLKSTLPGPDASKTTAYIAMAPGSSDISLFGMDIRQQDLFEEPKEPTVTEIKPVSAQADQQPKLADPSTMKANYAPTSN